MPVDDPVAPGDEADARSPRARLIRDVLVFQVKLFLDGVRDILLSPISIVLGLVGVISGGDKPGRNFYQLLQLGRRSERWLDLFGAADHHEDDEATQSGIDALVTRLESRLADPEFRDSMSKSARRALKQASDTLSREGFTASGTGSPTETTGETRSHHDLSRRDTDEEHPNAPGARRPTEP